MIAPLKRMLPEPSLIAMSWGMPLSLFTKAMVKGFPAGASTARSTNWMPWAVMVTSAAGAGLGDSLAPPDAPAEPAGAALAPGDPPGAGLGSGAALVMQLARVFSGPDVRTERSVRFVLWNNEETGLNGARGLQPGLG